MSLTEYVGRLNAIVDRMSQQHAELVTSPQGKVLVAEAAQLTDFTPQHLQVALERVRQIEIEVMEALDAIEPPEQVTDLHNLLFARYTSARVALAARAGTAADWEELSETPEMASYRAALIEDKQVCSDFQAKLDATEERGVFADILWLPSEVHEVVEALLGCGMYPEHPEDKYRPLSSPAP